MTGTTQAPEGAQTVTAETGVAYFAVNWTYVANHGEIEIVQVAATGDYESMVRAAIEGYPTFYRRDALTWSVCQVPEPRCAVVAPNDGVRVITHYWRRTADGGHQRVCTGDEEVD
jgi:hypothetical protein